MTITNRVSLKSVESGITPIDDVPDAPTIGAATNVGTSRAFNNGSATVAYTAAATGGPVTTFTATSTPGSFTGTGTSPITVTGLQSATSYTFTVSAANANGTQTSGSSSSITATTVPQAPTIGTFTDGGTGTTGTLSFTAGATGGSAITNYSYSTNSSTYTALSPAQTSSPLSLTGLTAGTYNFSVKAINANGSSAASSNVSGTVITPSNYEFISTVSGSASSYTFSGVPSSSYKLLQIRGMARSTSGGDQLFLTFNGDNNSNYTFQFALTYGNTYVGTGGDTSSGTYIRVGVPPYSTTTATHYGPTIIDITDPGSTTKNKTLSAFSGYNTLTSDQGALLMGSGLWRSTSAINSITLTLSSGDFASSSTFSLYGIS